MFIENFLSFRFVLNSSKFRQVSLVLMTLDFQCPGGGSVFFGECQKVTKGEHLVPCFSGIQLCLKRASCRFCTWRLGPHHFFFCWPPRFGSIGNMHKMIPWRVILYRISQHNGVKSSETGAVRAIRVIYEVQGSVVCSVQISLEGFSGFGVWMFPPSPQTPDNLDTLRQLLMDEGDAFMVDLAWFQPWRLRRSITLQTWWYMEELLVMMNDGKLLMLKFIPQACVYLQWCNMLCYDTEKPSFFLTLDVLVGSRSEAQQVSMTECWLKHLAPQLSWSGNNAWIVKHILQDVSGKIVVFKDSCYLLQHHFLLQTTKNLHVSIVASFMKYRAGWRLWECPEPCLLFWIFFPFQCSRYPSESSFRTGTDFGVSDVEYWSTLSGPASLDT